MTMPYLSTNMMDLLAAAVYPMPVYTTPMPLTIIAQSSLSLTTVKDQKTKYSNLDVCKATAARQLQVTIEEPTTKDFFKIIEKSLLKRLWDHSKGHLDC